MLIFVLDLVYTLLLGSALYCVVSRIITELFDRTRIGDMVYRYPPVLGIIHFLIYAISCVAVNRTFGMVAPYLSKEFFSITGVISFFIFVVVVVVGLLAGEEKSREFNETTFSTVITVLSLWWVIAWVIVQMWD